MGELARAARAALRAGLAALAVVAAGFGCTTPAVDVTVADPKGLRVGASYAQFLLFDSGCPSRTELIARSYAKPLVEQNLTAVEDFSELGTLDAKTYGFAAVLRSEDCGVLGVGCAEADLTERIDSVSIPLTEIYPQEAACPGLCADGRCESDGP